MRKLLILNLLFIIKIISQQTGIVEGKVIDKSTKQPIPFANIFLVNTNLGGSTDLDGYFKISKIPIGRYTIKVSSIGYETYTNTDVVVSTAHSIRFQFELSENPILIGKDVVVHGNYFQKDPANLVSTHSLSFEEIRRAPGAAEDISRVLLTLPGVLTSSDDRNDLLVRGGNPTENLNLIDNIDVPNINHFGTQGASGGPIGMLNTDLIREVIFSSGGFPVKYGDKLSSVLDIKLREGNREKVEGNFSLNMAGAGGLIEGPLFNKGSWVISAKKSYMDLISKLNATSLVIVPEYSNFQTKIVYDIDSKNQISLVGVGGLDHIYFNEGEYNLDSYFKAYKITSDQDQYALGINYRTLWSKQIYSLITLSNNYNHFFSDLTHGKTGSIFYRNQSFEREFHFKGELNYKISSSTEINIGFENKFINFSHAVDYLGDTAFTVTNGVIDTIYFDPSHYFKTVETSKSYGFIQATQWLFDKIKLIGGIRFDNFNFIDNSFSFSYRGGLSYYISPVTIFNLSYGKYFQTPPYIWLTIDESSRKLENMRCEHFVLGFEHFFDEDLKLTVEGYQKNYSKIPTTKNIPQFIASNGGSDYGAFIIRHLSSDGKGYSQGIEFTLQKKLLNNFYGIVSYGLSTARFTALDNIERDGSFDYRNVFTISAGYIPNDIWEVSFKWRYAGGRPYTPYDETLSTQYRKGVEDYAQLNSLRFPPYHRLDIRFDYRWHFKNWNVVTYLDLQNAYFRLNIYQYQWDVIENKQVEVYQWRFFPVAGVNIEF